MTPPWGVARSDKNNPVFLRQKAAGEPRAEEATEQGDDSSSTMEKPALWIKWAHQLTYPSVPRPNHRLNQRKNTPSGPRDSLRGLSSSADSAGLKESALKAEIMTDTAIVTANC